MRGSRFNHGGYVYASTHAFRSAGGLFVPASGGGGITMLTGRWDSFGLNNNDGLDTLSAETYGGSSVSGATWDANNTDMTFSTVETDDSLYNNSNNFNIYTAYGLGQAPLSTSWSGTVLAHGDVGGNTGRYLGISCGMHATSPDGKYLLIGWETYDLQPHVYVNTVAGGARSNTAGGAPLSVEGNATLTVSWNAATRVAECTDGTNTATLTLTADDVTELDGAARGQYWGFNARRGDWDTGNNVIQTEISED